MPQQPRADPAEQDDLEQRLAERDPAGRPEDPLEPRGRIDAREFGLEQFAVEAEGAEPRLSDDTRIDGDHQQANDPRRETQARLRERLHRRPILDVATPEAKARGHDAFARLDQRLAEQGEPRAPREHDQRRREIARFEDIALLDRVLAPLGCRQFCLVAFLLGHQPNTRRCVTSSLSWTMTSMKSPIAGIASASATTPTARLAGSPIANRLRLGAARLISPPIRLRQSSRNPAGSASSRPAAKV